ncbi:MAG: hypothetical protein ACRCSR_01665 [Bacteroidales bacterium]
MKLRALSFLVLLFSALSVFAKNDDKHEMSNMHAKINATEFRNSRHIETTEVSKKTYIKGKDSRYKDKETSRATQPYAEYPFAANAIGGDYTVTCIYRVDKKNAKDECYITLGLDELEVQRLDIKESLGVHRISHTFDVKMLRGKNHVLKLWLPSKGVMVERFEIRRKLISTKKK